MWRRWRCISAAADKRADLDLQINLLAEHEITRLVRLVSEISDHLGLQGHANPELEEIKQDVAPEAVLDEIEEAANGKLPADEEGGGWQPAP